MIQRTRTLVAVALLALAGVAAVATAPPAEAGVPCWKRLLDDWVKDGRIDGSYAPRCYEQALDRLPEDLEGYSSAREDISRALNQAVRNNGGERPRVIPPSDDPPDQDPLPTLDEDGDGQDDLLATGGGEPNAGDGFLDRLLPRAAGASSVPVPLLVLAGLALLLLGTAAATYVARRLQARRTPPFGGGPPA